MAETETQPQEAQEAPKQAAPEPSKDEGKQSQAVPYERFQEINEKAKQAEAEREELRQKLEEHEQAQLTEKERAEKRAEKAEQRATEAERKAVYLERSGWLRDAAARAGFHDPGDAVVHLGSKEFKDAREAQSAVVDLANEKEHLLMAERERQVMGSLQEQGGSTSVPLDADGNPDMRQGLGQDILRHLTKRR